MHLPAHVRKKTGNVPVPGWLLSAGMAVYCELLLHLWTTENLKPLRFGAVLAFSLGFGGLAGLLKELGALPECTEAQAALEGGQRRRRLFGFAREAS